MNLGDIASLICTEINQSETEDVSACKLFLVRGFALIWQAALWKDSLFEYTQTLGSAAYVTTDTWLPTKKVLLALPSIAEVIAVRTGTNRLGVESSETFYRSDFDAFSDTGVPRQFRLLPMSVWEFDTAQSVDIDVSESDPDKQVVIDYLDGNNVVNRATMPDSDGLYTNVMRVLSLTKQVTTVNVTLVIHNGATLVTLTPTQIAAQRRQAIQLFGTIAAGTIVRALGKIHPPTFSADSDEPALTGCENTLIAFGTAAMLRRTGQYQKAQLAEQRGVVLLEQLKKEQTIQQAHNKRLIPESGYGDEYGLMSGGFTTFP